MIKKFQKKAVSEAVLLPEKNKKGKNLCYKPACSSKFYQLYAYYFFILFLFNSSNSLIFFISFLLVFLFSSYYNWFWSCVTERFPQIIFFFFTLFESPQKTDLDFSQTFNDSIQISSPDYLLLMALISFAVYCKCVCHWSALEVVRYSGNNCCYEMWRLLKVL